MAESLDNVNSLVTMLTETHIKSSILSSEILVYMPDYEIFRCDRNSRQGGGVAIIVHSSMSGELIGSFDNEVVEFIVFKSHALNTVFCSIYRRPDTSLAEFSQALDELNKILSMLPSPMPTLVVGGDLNFPSFVLQWHNIDNIMIPVIGDNRGEGDGEGPKIRTQATKFFNLSSQFNLEQFVDKETHGKEILDFIFVNNSDIVHSVLSENFPLFTDHSLVTMSVSYLLKEVPQKGAEFVLDSARKLNKLNFSEAPWDRIREELGKIDWSDLLKLSR